MKKQIINLVLRYFLALLIVLFASKILFQIFLPLTIHPLNAILNIFYTTTLSENAIIINENTIKLIPACIATSAYILLAILNLTTPNITNTKRITLLALTAGAFYLSNLLRIILLSFMWIQKTTLFDFTHLFLWYFGSSILILIIWTITINKFKIRTIPIYDDFKWLIKNLF